MQTYRIVFRIDTPLCITYPFLPTFDGILGYGYVKEIFRNPDFREKYLAKIEDKNHKEFFKKMPFTSTIPQKMSYSEVEKINFDFLPLVKNEYFFASNMKIEYLKSENFGYIRKQWDKTRTQFSGVQKNLRINMGVTKSVQIEVPLKIAPEVSFIFATEDINEVLLLLTYIVGFGKKRNKQWGHIVRYDLQEVNYDWEIINRPIPQRLVTTEMIKKTGDVLSLFLAWQPPYHQTEREMCIINYEK